jgi:hypothetical protein
MKYQFDSEPYGLLSGLSAGKIFTFIAVLVAKARIDILFKGRYSLIAQHYHRRECRLSLTEFIKGAHLSFSLPVRCNILLIQNNAAVAYFLKLPFPEAK